MTDDTIKPQAEAIAAVVRATTSYVVGGFWTDGCALIRLPGTIEGPLKLTVACGCADPDAGCGCTCSTCESCDEGPDFCWDPWTCAAMESVWSNDAPEKMQGLAVRTVAGVLDGELVTLSRSYGRRARCVLGPSGQHVESGMFRDGIVHVAAHYVVAARRYAGVTSWRFVPPVNDVVKRPALAGYAGTTLAALVMPVDFVNCKRVEAA